VSPSLRTLVGQLASITVSDSSCEQNGIGISTGNIQLHVVKGTSPFKHHRFYAACKRFVMWLPCTIFTIYANEGELL